MFQGLTKKIFILFFTVSVVFNFAARAQVNRFEGENKKDHLFSASLSQITFPNAANVPDNLAGWHGGDGDTRDFIGAHNGTIMFDRTKFIVGKVGQALAFEPVSGSGGGGVQMSFPSVFRGQTEGTIETWVRLRGLPIGPYGFSAIWVEGEQNRSMRFGILYNNSGQIAAYSNFSGVSAVTPFAVPQNEWMHVAAVHKAGEPLRLYINGVSAAASSTNGTAFTDAPSPLISIGAFITLNGDDFSLKGDVDEASVYTRALSAGEIQSIFNAGTAGKLRQAATNTGENVSNNVRDATITFAAVTSAGATSQTPLETDALPALPAGFGHTGLAYDIQTTAVYTGNINICFNLPALVGESFSRLRILHLENDVWVNRTTATVSPQICGQAPRLSTFVIAENFVPTASLVTVGGYVTDGKRGIGGVHVTLMNAEGETRGALTDTSGFYRFTDIAAGETYVISVSDKRFIFSHPTQVLFVGEDLTRVDFVAEQNILRNRRSNKRLLNAQP